MRTFGLERPPAARRFGARLNVRQVRKGEALSFGSAAQIPHWRVELAGMRDACSHALLARETGDQGAIAALVDLTRGAGPINPQMLDIAIYASSVYSPMLAVAMSCRAHYIQWYAVGPDRTVRGLVRATQKLDSQQRLGPVINLDQVHAASADAIREAISELALVEAF